MVDKNQRNIGRIQDEKLARQRKTELGQFVTPACLARFMVDMFPSSASRVCRLLDAGAGAGALCCAFFDRWLDGGFAFKFAEVTAYEVDETLCGQLRQNLGGYGEVVADVIKGDYIRIATGDGLKKGVFTHVILNPPYRKIASKSDHRLMLRAVGIEAVNLYSAFVALALTQAVVGGQVVAIIPRSFCNGPYYRSFRNFIFKYSSIRRIHIFVSRSKMFKNDGVLQENVIIHLERGGKQGMVTVTYSEDDNFNNIISNDHPFERIVFPDDPEKFIHIPLTSEKSIIESLSGVHYSLVDLGLSVSTGPVVDFRLRDHLRNMPEEGAVPLLYPKHLNNVGVVWPVEGMKKPNAILRNHVTEKWLYPVGFYCVVRRFSSKEEKRRVVASVINPDIFGSYTALGFENHMNLFHENKHGLPEFLARGLAIFLNSMAVDEYFRRFNGHTQVNVTDLRFMKYPSRDVLIGLGKWAKMLDKITQEMIDEKIRQLMV